MTDDLDMSCMGWCCWLVVNVHFKFQCVISLNPDRLALWEGLAPASHP